MNTQIIIDYLSSLSMNNNRDWYHANKIGGLQKSKCRV